MCGNPDRVRRQNADSDFLISYEALLVGCFLIAGHCRFRQRGFLGRRFALCVLRPAKRLLHRPTDSRLYYQLGLYEAPVIDTSDPLHHVYGADALAFQFNRNGVLVAPPAYIAQALPYDFYMVRIGSLARGRATVDDVEALFGRGHTRADRPDGFMWYYALPVYNPFEERGGHRVIPQFL